MFILDILFLVLTLHLYFISSLLNGFLDALLFDIPFRVPSYLSKDHTPYFHFATNFPS